MISGLIVTGVSLIAWWGLQQAVTNETTKPFIARFPAKAGGQLEREFDIRTTSRYVIRLLFKPYSKREFETEHKVIHCDIEVKITKGDDLVLQKKVDRLDLEFESDEELGYDLVWTALLRPGRYNIELENQQEIIYSNAQTPTVVAFLNPAELETRLVLNEIVRRVCPTLALFGMITALVSLSVRKRASALEHSSNKSNQSTQ